MSLKGKTPAQATGLDLPLENGWGDLIQWALDSNGVPALEIAYTNKPEPEYKHKLFRSSWR